ncbi:MAG: transcriptional regulator [Thaumarchaeota archaeon]|nr:transcriptional regulator [Nitrososphaerota archaeon]
MPTQNYRNDLGIISDILSAAMEFGRNGALVSYITRRTNLSHYAVLERCGRLVDAGLLEQKNEGRTRIFAVTEKGVSFFGHLQGFLEMVRDARLRY